MSNDFYSKYLNFLKKHNLYEEEAFQYIRANALYIDYRDDEARDFIGCFYIYENNYLTKIRLCVPYICDEKTVLINIHEYIHAYLLYSKLNTKYKMGKEKEVIPMLYEKIYMLEHPSKELEEYEKYLNQFILNDDILEYKIALALQNRLVELYKPGMSIQQLNRKVKCLVKKWNKI